MNALGVSTRFISSDLRYQEDEKHELNYIPRKPTYPLNIDGWKMIHVLLKWSLFQGTNSFIFGDVWKLEICGVIAGDDATLPVSRLV